MFENKIVWITGASSGIGEALAIEFAKLKSKLILSARRENELIRVQNNCKTFTSEVEILPFDLTSVDFISISQKAISIFGTIDILINNGGISQRSSASETPIEIDRKIMELNYFSNIALTKAVLPQMIKNNNGRIVVMSSLSGKYGWKQRSAYSASKFALHGFYESLQAELSNTNIHVMIVCPGRVKTNISFNALKADGTKHNKMDVAQEKGIPADVCAGKIIAGLKSNKKELMIAGKEKLLLMIRRVIPSLYYNIAAKRDPNV